MWFALPSRRRSLLAALLLAGAVAQAAEPGAQPFDDDGSARADAAPSGAAVPPAAAPAAAVPTVPVPIISIPSLSLVQTHAAPRADAAAAHASWAPPGAQAPAFKLRERGVQAQLVELPSYSPGGSPTRPHHAVAFRSEAFRRFAHDGLGLDAERCLAPMVRLSTKLGRVAGGTGDSNATFWLLARCSLR